MRRIDYELAQEIAKEIEPPINDKDERWKNHLLFTSKIVESVYNFLTSHMQNFIETKDRFNLPDNIKTGIDTIDNSPVFIKGINKVKEDIKSKKLEYKKYMELMAFEVPLLICVYLLKDKSLTAWKKNVITGMIIAHFTWTLYGGGKLLDEFWYNRSKYVNPKYKEYERYQSYKHYLEQQIRNYHKRKDLLFLDHFIFEFE